VINRPVETSPQAYARFGGVVYLMIIVAGIFGEMFVRNALVVWGDAAATASHIQASRLLWSMGIAGDLLMHVGDVFLMWVFYLLLRPVHRPLALLAVLFHLIQTGVLIANKINLLMPLFLLGGAAYLKPVEPGELQALAYLAIKLHGYGFSVGLIFFGFACLVYGYLIFRSGYLPKLLGLLMQVAGLGYLVNSFAMLLAPGFAAKISPGILLPSFVAELTLCLWLIVKGVNVPKWNARMEQVVKGCD
jgi:hypothetical protein